MATIAVLTLGQIHDTVVTATTSARRGLANATRVTASVMRHTPHVMLSAA